ncbi:large conductance mechanosensitive channel protein MscL [Gordonia sp. CPCC 205333]|uniref:large conductance mechanosensitive channel protein MscL n=1 Tax=Gordonia sp. CPCC 205333 TaxID=3140790 RepID=UPI003AF4011B
MLKGFKEFILKGNVVELATAVIIGAAFTAIVTAFTTKIIQPLINAIPIGTDKADGLGFKITDNANTFVDIGAVITAVVNFIIVAAVVYFIIVLPYNKLSALAGFTKDDAEQVEVALLTEIRDILDPEAAAKAKAKTVAEADANRPASDSESFESGPFGRGPQPPAGGPQQGFTPQGYPGSDGPAIVPSRDLGGPPSGAIPLQTHRFPGPAVQPSQPPQGPPPAAPAGGGYAPPSPAPGPGQGSYPPPPQGNYPPQGQGNTPPPSFPPSNFPPSDFPPSDYPPSDYPPSGGFPAQGGDPDAPGRHSR